MLPIPRGLFGVPGMLGTKQPGTPPEGMRLDPGFGAKPTTPQQRRGLFGGPSSGRRA